MPLHHILSDAPVIKVVDFLLNHTGSDYTKKEIAEYAGVTQGAVKRDLGGLVDCGMVLETRKIGVFQLYTINNADPVMTALIGLEGALSDYMSKNDEEELFAPEGLDPDTEEELVVPEGDPE